MRQPLPRSAVKGRPRPSFFLILRCAMLERVAQPIAARVRGIFGRILCGCRLTMERA